MNRLYIIFPALFQIIIWPLTRFILIFFGHLEIRGLEKLKYISKKEGIIFASNHSSEIDPFVIPACLPMFSGFLPLYYVTRGKSFYNENIIRRLFYGGILFSLMGGQPVYAGLSDYSKSLSKHVELLKNGKNICIFPEGGITKDGSLSTPHSGISYLAETTNSIVIPIAISGVYNMSLIDFIKRKRSIIIIFGEPINYFELSNLFVSRNYNNNMYRIKSEYIMSRIGELIINK